MLATLTDTAVVSIRDVGVGWDVRSLLRAVAAADPPVHALIDTGALAGAYTRPPFSAQRKRFL